MRADALRNRELVLATASRLVAAGGVEVTLRDVADAAGVGLGTVGRHFPTKQALLAAVFADRVQGLAAEGRALIEAENANGFESYFASVVSAGDASAGLSQALASHGFNLVAATSGDLDVIAILDRLLGIAQRAGRIDAKLTRDDIKRLVTACASGDPLASGRLTTLVLAGMRAMRPPSQ